MKDIEYKLKRPFPVKSLHWRVGATNKDKTSGIALAYITARDVMNRLDECFGWDGWDCTHSHVNNIITCRLTVNIGGMQVTREGGAGETQIEAEKGGLSDSMKRAAVLFGIGRYLYSLPNIWVPIERGRLPESSIELLNSRLPTWATPEGFDEIMEKRKAA